LAWSAIQEAATEAALMSCYSLAEKHHSG